MKREIVTLDRNLIYGAIAAWVAFIWTISDHRAQQWQTAQCL